MSVWDEVDDEDRRPARRVNRRRREDDDEDDFDNPRDRRSSSNTNKIILIILGSVGVLMLACGGMAYYFVSNVKKAVDKAQAAQATQTPPFKYVGTQTKPLGSGPVPIASASPPKMPDPPDVPGEMQFEISNLRVEPDRSGLDAIHFDYKLINADTRGKVFPVILKCGERWIQSSVFLRAQSGTFSSRFTLVGLRDPIPRPITVWVCERTGGTLSRISEKLTLE